MKGNVARMPDIAVFSDELRDGLCGPVWEKIKVRFLPVFREERRV